MSRTAYDAKQRVARAQARETVPALTHAFILNLAQKAEAADQELVEIKIYRPGPLKGHETLRLLGTNGGPDSCADTAIVELAPWIYSAKWRVADLRLWLEQQQYRKISAAPTQRRFLRSFHASKFE